MVGGDGRNRSFGPLLLLVAVAAQALIFLQPRGAAADFLSPLFSPLRNASCELAQCGKGTCKPSDNSSNTSFLELLGPGFTCECDPGWKRLINNNDSFGFLPCVLPNCSMNYACAPEAPPPPPPPPTSLFNWSIFDPCTLAACGEGACVKTSPLSYRCDCRTGTRNLLNYTSFPCFRDCVLGADCTNLGLGVPPSVSAPTTNASPPSAAINGPKMNILLLSVLMMMLLVATA